MRKIFRSFLFLLVVLFVVSPSCIFASDWPSVAVVLSGGGAKGVSHIALLEKLEELGIPIDCVLGTSMGALIGGLYSAGYTPAEIRELIETNNLAQLFSDLISSGYRELAEPFKYSRSQLTIGLGKGVVGIPGFIDDYKIMNFFNNALGNIPEDYDFDMLPTRFRCIGTNAITGEEKIFKDGSLIDSMRASMSIPIAFAPKKIDGEIYVDGGLVNNMPVNLAREMGYDIVIAEDVNAKIEITEEKYESISGIAGALFRVAINNTINNQRDNADVLLTPDMRGVGILSFNNPDSIIQRGEEEVELKAEELEQIAGLFSEDQKEYKDPNRTGEYFTKFSYRERNYYKSTWETMSQGAFEQTRFSSRLEFPVTYTFVFGEKGSSTFVLNPSVNLNLFYKNRKHNNINTNIALKLGSIISVNPEMYIKFTDNKDKLNLFGVPGLAFNLGTQSNITDRDSLVSYNKSEWLMTAKVGLKLTDEKSANMNLNAFGNIYGTKTQLLYEPFDVEDDTYTYCYLYPKVELSGVWYDILNINVPNSNGLRIDVQSYFGYIKRMNRDVNNLTYKFSVAIENEYMLGKKEDSLEVDFQVASSREPKALKDSYYEYGGDCGVPGYPVNAYYSDFIMGGLIYRHIIKDGIFSSYVEFAARAAVRSRYDIYNNGDDPDYYDYDENLKAYGSYVDGKVANSMIPLYDCFGNRGVFDVGAYVALGIESQFGDYKLGFGMNKDFQASVFFVLR